MTRGDAGERREVCLHSNSSLLPTSASKKKSAQNFLP